MEHLVELRRRIVFSVIALLLATIASFPFAGWIYRYVVLSAVDVQLVVLAVEEAFYLHLRIALVSGLVISLPFILYSAIAFVLPALTRSEKRKLFFYLPMGFILFVAGIAFGYFQVLPILTRFFLGFTSETLRPMISASSFLGFVFSTILPFGFLFEMPLLVALLTGLGIIGPEFLRSNRKFTLLILFVLSALLTPPDVTSQILMVVPPLLLYEVSIVISLITARGRRGKPADKSRK